MTKRRLEFHPRTLRFELLERRELMALAWTASPGLVVGPAPLFAECRDFIGPRLPAANVAIGIPETSTAFIGPRLPPLPVGATNHLLPDGEESPYFPVITAEPWTAPNPPGVVVDWEPAQAQRYVGSPSIVVLPGGEYLAAHDLAGAGTSERTELFVSVDRGQTWAPRSTIVGQYWSTLLLHTSQLYLLGTDRVYGSAVIRKSTDGGVTWTMPRDSSSGLLLAGRYHTAPVPVVVHGGRIWRAMEEVRSGGWGMNFLPFVMSAPVGADLLRASSWTTTNRIVPNGAWLHGNFGGFLEGNIVVAPDGGIVNVLRVHQPGYHEVAARVQVSADGRIATFVPATGFAVLPGAAKKFTIRFDAASGRYWTVSNYVPLKYRGPDPSRRRNTLVLASSDDLRTWRVERVLLENPNLVEVGFQYADWQIDGDDLVAVLRTSYYEPTGGSAANYHDANYLTFHRIRFFRGQPG